MGRKSIFSNPEPAAKTGEATSPALSPAEQAKKAKEVEAYLKNEKKEWDRVQLEPKLLLLGTSDSGKSTLLKQMKILHSKGFSEQEKKLSTQAIRCSILSALKKLMDRLTEMTEEFEDKYIDIAENEDNDPSEYIELAPLCLSLWKEECIQDIFKNLPNNILPGTIEHFLNSIERVSTENYAPSDEDILKLRTVTQNIAETIFNIQGKNFHFFDVSGLKYHRKYWLPYFEKVTSILFVVSLSSYDQMMMEEGNTNRMTDALFVWKTIVNHPTLLAPNVILFLNKMDLFEKKVKSISVKDFFPDYDGKPHSVSGGVQFFDKKFRDLVDNKEKGILTHATQATDTKAMEFIITGMLQSIIDTMLKDVGLGE